MNTTPENLPDDLAANVSYEESPVKIQGAHVSVHVSTWTSKKSFEKKEFRNKGGDAIASRTAPVQVYMIDCPELKHVQTLGQNLRQNLDSRLHSLQMVSINTHITGEGIGQGRKIKTRFIPFARLAAWWKRHTTLKGRFYAAVEAFLKVYEKAREKQLPQLMKDGLADQIEWPTVESLRSKFGVTEDIRVASWESNMAFSVIEYAKDAGKEELEVLEDLAKAQEARLRNELGKAADQLAAALAANMESTYKEMLTILQKKANGDRTKLCVTRVEEFLEFFQACRGLNVSNNAKLEEVVDSIENMIRVYGIDSVASFKDKADTDPQGLMLAFTESLQEVETNCGEVQRDLIL